VIPIPTIAQLAQYSGRPEASYTGYANSALLQACIVFVTITEVGYGDASNTQGFDALNADDQLLATQGILAYADWTYLKQPYQQMIASPAMEETIGSYSYSKPPPIQVRNVQAQELGIGSTGIELWDTAIQYLSKRTRANGVFFGQLECFERTNNSADQDQMIMLRIDRFTGERVLLGPADFNRVDIPGFGVGINAPGFPGDPGV
jgi:hypothetical protein